MQVPTKTTSFLTLARPVYRRVLTSTLQKLGYKSGIISGGFDYFGESLQKSLNLDYVFANLLEIENGKVTGKVTGDIIDGWRKAEILKTIATVENISLQQTIAIGDGANDLPMLSTAGLGIAFHAKSIVKKNAQKSISSVGLDGLLYLMGISERKIRQPSFGKKADVVHIVTAKSPIYFPGVAAARDYTSVGGASVSLP